MSTHKKIDIICVVVTAFAVVITILFMKGEKFGLTSIVDEDAEKYEDFIYFTVNDQNGNWDDADATIITLNQEECSISGNGAYAYDNKIVISSGGYYIIEGEWQDGNIIVDAYQSSKVFIKLNGVDLYCSDDACLRVEQADKVFLTLAMGSENYFESGEEYSEESQKDGTGGVIFAHDDLTINGEGSLTVTAHYKHGIDANDDLIIAGGNIMISAPKDTIHVNDSIRIKDASLVLEAGDDGMHSDSDILIAGGTISIPACYEGIEALTIDITGGEIEIYPEDDGINANGGNSDMFGMGWMDDRIEFDVTDSNRGEMKVTDNISSKAGMFTEETDVNNQRAELFNPNAQEERRKAEELSKTKNTEEQDETEDTYIHISGGTIVIVNEKGQDADGLDSNGSILISGGEIYVSLSGNGTNNAIDYGSENNGVCEINGGTIVACGGNAMVEEMSDTSTQCSILYNLSSVAAAGSIVKLTDQSGSVVLTYDVPCSFNSAVISAPDMKMGETYTLVMGDITEEITLEETASTYGAVATGFMGFVRGNMRGGGFRRAQNGEQNETDGQRNFTPPEENGFTLPDQNGENRKDGSGFFQSNEKWDGNMKDMKQIGVEQDDGMVTVSNRKDVTTEEWVWLAAAASVLIMAIGVASMYKRW